MATRRFTQHAGYLLCRTIGHAWFPIPADKPGTFGGDPMWLRCERCDTERHDSISTVTGELTTRRYVYEPNGYRTAFATDFADAAPTKNDFRRMLLAEHILDARETRTRGSGAA